MNNDGALSLAIFFSFVFIIVQFLDKSSKRRRRRKKYVGQYKTIKDSGKTKLEHRLIAEEVLGRKLKRGEVVHHINGKRGDNRKANLCVMSWDDH